MKHDKKESKINELQDEFNKIQEANKDLDVGMYLAKPEDMPDFGEIQIYDYNKDLEEARVRSDEVLTNMVELFLGDDKSLINNKYIQDKMKEDALVYADTLFLTKATRNAFILQCQQINAGDNSARMHEVVNQTIGQIRENIKFSTSQRSELENFYKTIRKDLGIADLSEKNKIVGEEIQDDTDGKVVDTKNLNDMIDNYVKNKK
jgi:hypothetical protein